MEWKVTVIPPISREAQERLMPSQSMVAKKARARLGVQAVREPSLHADGSKRRRRVSKRQRDAAHLRDDKHYEYMPKDGQAVRPKIR